MSWMIKLMKLMILVLTRMQMPEMVLRRLLHTQEAERRGGKKIHEKQRQRVIVVDEKMDIQNESLSLGDATQPLMNLDILYVKDVGYGMTRGMMDLGRLYQGYYVPPDRKDFEENEEEQLEKSNVM